MVGIFLLLCVPYLAWAVQPFAVTDCNNSPNKIFHLENVHLSQDPIIIPGNETLSLDVQILKPIDGKHHNVVVFFSKKVLFGWFAVPCTVFGNFSCHFELCDILSGTLYNTTHHCPLTLEHSSPDLPCACPFKPGTYSIKPTTFAIPEFSSAWSRVLLSEADIKATLTVIDTYTNEQVACLEVQASTKQPECNGSSCLFGKK